MMTDGNNVQGGEGGDLFGRLIVDQWKDQEDGGLVLDCLEYLDVVTLIKKKSLCKEWMELCTKTINDKCGGDQKKKKSFQSNNELQQAIRRYSPGFRDDNTMQCNSKDAEEIASTYGYPIGKWDVSNVTDFSRIFHGKFSFNEAIGSWDVSNVTDMRGMFCGAESFNQDISSWDVSNVTNMRSMFCFAWSFNQDISSWDVSNVTDMYCMFYGSSSFNQDISTWDVSNVTDMSFMFRDAQSFNQDISAWDVSNVYRFFWMFRGCLFDARQLPWFTADS